MNNTNGKSTLTNQQVAFRVKLNALLKEVETEAIKKFEAGEIDCYHVEIDHSISMIDRCDKRGRLIDLKKHGINAASLVMVQICSKC